MTRSIRSALAFLFPLLVAARGVYRLIQRPITVGVRALVIDDGQVLLVRAHGSPIWTMPGGGVHRDESVRAAAIREAREETGCPVEAERLLGLYLSRHQGMTNHVAVFVCRPATGSAPTMQLNLEITEARYWPLNALPTIDAPLQRRLAEYAAGATGLDAAW